MGADRESNTFNKFLVARRGEQVIVMNPVALGRGISKAEALELAAWLVALADGGPESFAEVFAQVMAS